MGIKRSEGLALVAALLVFAFFCIAFRSQLLIDIDRVSIANCEEVTECMPARLKGCCGGVIEFPAVWPILYMPPGLDLGYKGMFYLQFVYSAIFISLAFLASRFFLQKLWLRFMFALLLASSSFLNIVLRMPGRDSSGIALIGLFFYFSFRLFSRGWASRAVFGLCITLFALSNLWPIYPTMGFILALLLFAARKHLNKRDIVPVAFLMVIIAAELIILGFANPSNVVKELSHVKDFNPGENFGFGHYISKSFIAFTPVDYPYTMFLERFNAPQYMLPRIFFTILQLALMGVGVIAASKNRKYVTLVFWGAYLIPVFYLIRTIFPRYLTILFPAQFALIALGAQSLKRQTAIVKLALVGLVIFNIIFTMHILQVSREQDAFFIEKPQGRIAVFPTYSLVEELKHNEFHEVTGDFEFFQDVYISSSGGGNGASAYLVGEAEYSMDAELISSKHKSQGVIKSGRLEASLPYIFHTQKARFLINTTDGELIIHPLWLYWGIESYRFSIPSMNISQEIPCGKCVSIKNPGPIEIILASGCGKYTDIFTIPENLTVLSSRCEEINP